MRRRHRKKNNLYNFIFILIIFLTFISASYGYLTTQIKISGQIKGLNINNDFIIDPSSNPNLRISKPTINKWQAGGKYNYQYTFTLSNIGNIDYDNFTVTIWYSDVIKIENSWNYNYGSKSKVLTISNVTYDLLANNSLQIGFIISSSKANLYIEKVKLEASSSTQEADPSKFLVVFTKTSEWGSYTYQYDVKLTNNTGVQITYWQLDITLPEGTTFISGWNGTFTQSGNILTVKNTSSNGRLRNGDSTSFGMQLNTNIINYLPTSPKITIR